jgi:hypothetical protein
LPTDATVWKRSPRPSASALTATFPLCETSATWPAARGTSASPHSAAPAWNATIPSQFGPIRGERELLRGVAQLGLQRGLARLCESRAEDDEPAAAAPSGRPDHVGHARGGDRDDDRVDRLRQVVDRRHARSPVHLAPGRVHAPDRSGEAERGEVAQRCVAVRAGAVGRADDGDGARTEQPREIELGAGRVGAGPGRGG